MAELSLLERRLMTKQLYEELCMLQREWCYCSLTQLCKDSHIGTRAQSHITAVAAGRSDKGLNADAILHIYSHLLILCNDLWPGSQEEYNRLHESLDRLLLCCAK